MSKKHSFLAIALLGSSTLYANVPIESYGLSQSDASSTPTATATTAEPVATNLNWQLVQKNQQLENDLRVLRGQLEEQAHTLEQLKQDSNNRYTDLDQRLELLNQKVDPDSNAATNEADTANQAPSAANKETLSTNAAATANTTANNQANNSSESDKAAYTVALEAYKQGGAKNAIAPMQDFIKNHPNSIYAANAHFWLAEFNLAIDPVDYLQAKKNYQIVAEQYPTSGKAPRSLYQLYSIAKDVDHKPAVAAQFKSKLLAKYPNSKEATFLAKNK